MKLAWLVKSDYEDDDFEIKFEEPESWYSHVIPIVYEELDPTNRPGASE